MDAGTSSVIDRKLKHLQDRLAFLHAKEAVGRTAFLQDQTLQLAVERAFQEVIEACLDIGRRVLIDADMPLPDQNRDIFRQAAVVGAVPPEYVERLGDMAGFRNVLVHEYDRVDSGRVHEALTTRLGDIDAFAAAVVAYLRRQEGLS